MNQWQIAATVAALVGAVGAGAALAPVAHGQGSARVAPRAMDIFTVGGSRIGVSIEDVAPGDTKAAQAGGVVVGEVTEDSPASKAGIRTGDVIVEFDGERVRSARQFTRLVQESVPNRPVQAVVARDGQRTTLTVQPAERDTRLFDGDNVRMLEDFGRFRVTPPSPRAAPVPPAPRGFPDVEGFIWRSGNTLGITIDELSPQLAEYFGTKDGVLVASVTPDSAAARAGLKAGDVITSFNGTSVGSTSELRRQIQDVDDGGEFTVGVVRDRKSLTLKGKADERRDRRRSFRSIV
jgi:serine protease Do